MIHHTIVQGLRENHHGLENSDVRQIKKNFSYRYSSHSSVLPSHQEDLYFSGFADLKITHIINVLRRYFVCAIRSNPREIYYARM